MENRPSQPAIHPRMHSPHFASPPPHLTEPHLSSPHIELLGPTHGRTQALFWGPSGAPSSGFTQLGFAQTARPVSTEPSLERKSLQIIAGPGAVIFGRLSLKTSRTSTVLKGKMCSVDKATFLCVLTIFIVFVYFSNKNEGHVSFLLFFFAAF